MMAQAMRHQYHHHGRQHMQTIDAYPPHQASVHGPSTSSLRSNADGSKVTLIAKHDFAGDKRQGQLVFFAGEQIHVRQKDWVALRNAQQQQGAASSSWIAGVHHGKRGWFPSSYAQSYERYTMDVQNGNASPIRIIPDPPKSLPPPIPAPHQDDDAAVTIQQRQPQPHPQPQSQQQFISHGSSPQYHSPSIHPTVPRHHHSSNSSSINTDLTVEKREPAPYSYSHATQYYDGMRHHDAGRSGTPPTIASSSSPLTSPSATFAGGRHYHSGDIRDDYSGANDTSNADNSMDSDFSNDSPIMGGENEQGTTTMNAAMLATRPWQPDPVAQAAKESLYHNGWMGTPSYHHHQSHIDATSSESDDASTTKANNKFRKNELQFVKKWIQNKKNRSTNTKVRPSKNTVQQQPPPPPENATRTMNGDIVVIVPQEIKRSNRFFSKFRR
mmetsp:Transcript_2483/g.6691  ORF Transcript_2483/g.6691 Transcript_2483/m.6691 type:complete len:441 (-) Transcript_2483:47-1369(-)